MGRINQNHPPDLGRESSGILPDDQSTEPVSDARPWLSAASIFDMQLGKAFGAGLKAIRQSIPRFVSLAKELAHEVVGFMFFAFAAVFVFGPFGFIQNFEPGGGWNRRLVVSGIGALVFIWFGIDSFRRAKRLARKR